MSLTELFQSIADAIRNISGNNEKIQPTKFSEEINKMSYIEGVNGPVNKVNSAKPELSLSGNTITACTSQNTGYVSDGGSSNTLTLNSKDSQIYTPTSNDQIIKSGQYLVGDQTILGDTNLKSEYILRGRRIDNEETRISIFGVKGTCDRLRLLPKNIDENVYGLLAANCAKSYHIARIIDGVKFRYSQNHGICGDGLLTDEDGRCWIDCSTLGSLILRLIPYNESPYAKVAGQANKNLSDINLTSNVLSDLNNSDPYLDMQTHEDFKFSFKIGYKSIRTAAEQAEYLYQMGVIVYEYELGNSPTTIPSDIRGGDFVFWAKDNATDRQKSRFKSISHVGIISHDRKHVYQVTGYSDERIYGTNGNELSVMYCSNLSEKLDEIVLIARPDYKPKVNSIVPLNINILPQYEFDSLVVDSTKTTNGITFNPLSSGGFSVQITDSSSHTAHTTFYLCNKSYPIILSPGTYEISGTPIHSEVKTSSTSYTWGLSVKNATTGNNLTNINGDDHVWDRGIGDTFTISETINAYVYFFVSSNLSDTAKYTVIPSLKRIS